jgi:hypothetical protein
MLVEINFHNIKNEVPDLKKVFTSEPLFFILNNHVYMGYYHCNGCFYGNDTRISAHTHIALQSYSLDQLPKESCEFWAYEKDCEMINK